MKVCQLYCCWYEKQLNAFFVKLTGGIILKAIFCGRNILGSMFLISGVLMIAYSAFAEANWEGATLGKRLIGLKVQTIDGKKISLDKALVRNISKIYPVLPLIDWIIGIVTPGDDRRQKYTDRIVGTTVVQVSEPFASFTSAKK